MRVQGDTSVNGNRLTYVLLSIVITILGFLALQVWGQNALIAEINATRFTSSDALMHERIENQRFADVVASINRMETQRIIPLEMIVVQLPPKDFRDRIRAIEMELVRRYGFNPTTTDDSE
jgi:hypothetical protein